VIGSTPVVHVIEDDPSVRTAVTRLLRVAGFESRAYASAAEFLIAKDIDSPGCVVLDVGLPGMDGMELYSALSRRRETAVVFLTGRGDVQMSVSAMKAGAVDFLTKPVKRGALLEAVGRALDRDRERRTRGRAVSGLRASFDTLTERERQVFQRVVQGRLNKQIADELGTSIRTVKVHRARVMEKMQVASLADLVRAADRLNAPAS
jgi:FixJ family two-component response regulator